jgi:hypothetical protein
MNAKAWDAKKAELEAKLIVWGTKFNPKVAEIEAQLAALGPRPAERVVTYVDGKYSWTWTYDGTEFHRSSNVGSRFNGQLLSILMHGMPPAKVIEVAALALPEGPAGYANRYDGGEWSSLWPTAYDASSRSSKAYTPAEIAVPLYRTPQPQGVEVGACVISEGRNIGMWSTQFRSQKECVRLANESAGDGGDGIVCKLIAIPIPEEEK